MSTGLTGTAPARAPDLRRAVILGSNLAMIALLWGARHDNTTLILLLALHAARTAVNVRAERASAKWIASNGAMFGVHAFNIIVNVAISHVAGWPLAALMYVAWQAAIISGLRANNVAPIAVVHVAVTAATMLIDRVPLFSVVITCGCALIVYVAIHARGEYLEDALRQLAFEHERLADAHDQLAVVHKELVERDRLTSLGLIAAGLAHEINNPMTFVTNNVALLLEDLPRYPELSDETKRDYVDDLLPATLEGIRRVNAIVADLRQFARGDIEEVTAYDVATQLAAAVRVCKNRYADGPRLEMTLCDAEPLSGRPRQICQILVSMLVNAAQATPKSGAVRVVMRNRPDAVVLDVEDGGGQGTGLGLSVVHGVVGAHGGTVEVLQPPTGRTTVRVTLPRSQALQKSRTTSSKLATKASLGPSM